MLVVSCLKKVLTSTPYLPKLFFLESRTLRLDLGEHVDQNVRVCNSKLYSTFMNLTLLNKFFVKYCSSYLS